MGGLIVEGTIYSNDCKQHLVDSFYQQEHLLKKEDRPCCPFLIDFVWILERQEIRFVVTATKWYARSRKVLLALSCVFLMHNSRRRQVADIWRI